MVIRCRGATYVSQELENGMLGNAGHLYDGIDATAFNQCSYHLSSFPFAQAIHFFPNPVISYIYDSLKVKG